MSGRPLDFRTDCILTPNSRRRESRRKLSVLSRLSMLHSKKQVANAVACLGFAFLMLYILQVIMSFVKHSSGTGVAVLAITLVLSVLLLPEDPFYPPLKYGWRVFTGLTIFCSLCNLYALLFIHKVDTYSRDVRSLFPQSSQAVSPRTEYGVDCDPITWKKIYMHLDIFAVAHLVGCAFKAIIFRQYEILWTYSLAWELTEYCFVHLLPNFAECWWDRILLDVVICNGLGYYIGIQFCKMNSLPMFDWHSTDVSRKLMTFCCVSRQTPSASSAAGEDGSEGRDGRDRSRDVKARVSESANLPNSTVSSTASSKPMESLGSPSMSLAVAIFVGLSVGQVSELNTFLYKHFFNIPPHTHLMAARTTLCAVIPIPLIANLFAMTRGPYTLTTHSKAVLLLTATDTLFSMKFGVMTFPTLDLLMVSLWVVAMALLTVACIVLRSIRAVFCREACSSHSRATPVATRCKIT
ncbi:phosphatidylserine synthase 1-like [Tropilaelaps mercedesae]|uniref:Phosphatidylserine synthase n=1 Tax=Tropilaelaps mercedesae TaxID=418985 RepID=A0A1V9XWF1_9ACAR|nr:phosphatidylserine synthase 1-like [Tropilaelaps mercedesae]